MASTMLIKNWLSTVVWHSVPGFLATRTETEFTDRPMDASIELGGFEEK